MTRKDPETQVCLARNRVYHPTLGRWIQRDPIRYRDGMNLYEYVGSSPTNLTDAFGLQKCYPLVRFTGGKVNKTLTEVKVKIHVYGFPTDCCCCVESAQVFLDYASDIFEGAGDPGPEKRQYEHLAHGKNVPYEPMWLKKCDWSVDAKIPVNKDTFGDYSDPDDVLKKKNKFGSTYKLGDMRYFRISVYGKMKKGDGGTMACDPYEGSFGRYIDIPIIAEGPEVDNTEKDKVTTDPGPDPPRKPVKTP